MNGKSEIVCERLLRLLTPALRGREKATFDVSSHREATTATTRITDVLTGESATLVWAERESGVEFDLVSGLMGEG